MVVAVEVRRCWVQISYSQQDLTALRIELKANSDADELLYNTDVKWESNSAMSGVTATETLER